MSHAVAVTSKAPIILISTTYHCVFFFPDKGRTNPSLYATNCRSQWPRGLRRRSTAARLLRSWDRIPPAAWMFVVSVLCCQVEVSATS